MSHVLALPTRVRPEFERAQTPPSALQNPVAERGLLARFPVVLVPGVPGSGGDRRQSAWLRQLPRFARVDVPEPDRQDLDAWARAIVEAAVTFADPVIVMAHGFGCVAAIHASSLQSQLIAGALLVAPVNPANYGFGRRLACVVPDFPTVLAASDTDPWLSTAQAQQLADDWGSELVKIGNARDISPIFGYIGWKAGVDLLERLCRCVVRPSNDDVTVAA